MLAHEIIDSLSSNRTVFERLLKPVPEGLQRWRPADGQWSLLEVICHLYDEEREDFRPRTRLALNNGEGELLEINLEAWTKERAYIKRDYQTVLKEFLIERERSVKWLSNLERPDWEASLQHPQLGSMSASSFLANWLAHDFHHIRQINRIKYDWLKYRSGQDLNYAGKWSP